MAMSQVILLATWNCEEREVTIFEGYGLVLWRRPIQVISISSQPCKFRDGQRGLEGTMLQGGNGSRKDEWKQREKMAFCI